MNIATAIDHFHYAQAQKFMHRTTKSKCQNRAILDVCSSWRELGWHFQANTAEEVVTKTRNGEWGMGNGEWGMGNGEWGMGNGELKNGKYKNGEWEI